MKRLLKVLFLCAVMFSVMAVTDNKVIAAEVDEVVNSEVELESLETLSASGNATVSVITGQYLGNNIIMTINFRYTAEYNYDEGYSSEMEDATITVISVSCNLPGTYTFVENDETYRHDYNTFYQLITVNGTEQIKIYISVDEYGDFDFSAVPV